MRRWQRQVFSVMAVALGLFGSSSVAWGQAPTSPAADDRRADQVGAPPDGSVVHSWTLVPAVSSDPDRTGSRPNLSYEVTPGTTIADAVTVFNFGTVPLTFGVFGTDAFNNSEGQFDLLPTDEEPSGAGSWVTVAQESITVPVGAKATLPITIAVPPDARPGDHAGALLASSPTSGTGPDGKVVTFDRRTGTRLYIRVAGPLAPELAVENVRTSYRPTLNPLSGTAEVTYRIENRGNVRLGGEYRVSVGGPFGLGTKRTAPKELSELLPGEGVTLSATFDGVPAAGIAFTDVDVEPVESADLSPVAGRSTSIAVPFSVIAFLLITGLSLYARRAHLRHQGPIGRPEWGEQLR